MRPRIRLLLLALCPSNPEGIAIVPPGRHPHHQSRRTRAARRLPFAPARDSPGGLVAHEFSPVCGQTIREVDRVFARENLAAGSALVAGSGIAGLIVVLQLRESDAGAHRVPGRMARKRAAKTLLPDAARRGWRAIQSQAQNCSRPNVAA